LSCHRGGQSGRAATKGIGWSVGRSTGWAGLGWAGLAGFLHITVFYLTGVGSISNKSIDISGHTRARAGHGRMTAGFLFFLGTVWVPRVCFFLAKVEGAIYVAVLCFLLFFSLWLWELALLGLAWLGLVGMGLYCGRAFSYAASFD
jgi:hypothetical protein